MYKIIALYTTHISTLGRVKVLELKDASLLQ